MFSNGSRMRMLGRFAGRTTVPMNISHAVFPAYPVEFVRVTSASSTCERQSKRREA